MMKGVYDASCCVEFLFIVVRDCDRGREGQWRQRQYLMSVSRLLPFMISGDLVTNGQIQMLIITPSGDELDKKDGRALRRQALAKKVPIITTLRAAQATLHAIAGLRKGPVEMKALQDYFTTEPAAVTQAAKSKVAAA